MQQKAVPELQAPLIEPIFKHEDIDDEDEKAVKDIQNSAKKRN